MSQGISPSVMVGNEFVLQKPVLRVPKPAKIPSQIAVVSAPASIQSIPVKLDTVPIESSSVFSKIFEFMHRYSLGVFAVLFLIVASSGIYVGSLYWSARISPDVTSTSTSQQIVRSLHGPNTMVATTELPTTLQHINSQPITLTIGSKSVVVSSDVVSTWTKTVVDHKTNQAYIHVDDKAIAASLKSLTEPYAYPAIDQITTTHPDGSTQVVVAGRNGTSLTDTSKFSSQLASGLLAAKGAQLEIPLQPVPFHSLTPADFTKMIEVDVTTKRMYAYENGQVAREFLVSAGAPATPTPLGQFKIFSKPARQDMRGFNPDGTKYFQPNVQWINYFSGGNAIHGNYWRPTSYFGNINSSHGCVSVPNDEAKWVYDWAPMGTTVITHA